MQSKFEEIEAFLNSRNEGLFNPEASVEDEVSGLSGDMIQGNIGFLKIEGALSYKLTGMEALCGGCSYLGLLEDVDKLLEHGVSGIVMKVNSGGGEAYRCFETSRAIRAKCDEAGIPLIGYIDGMACSAAYALISSCNNVVINPDAEAGSIGVVIRLQNNNEAMKKAGIKTKYITAGASKVPFDEEGEFREEFITDLQNRVYSLYDNFVNHVVSMRGGKISDETVRETEARVFSAEEARAKGLIDEIMEEAAFDSFLKEKYNLSAQIETEAPKKNIGDTLMSEETIPQLSTEEVIALQAQLAGMQEMQAKLAQYEAKETEAKTASLTALVVGAQLSNADAIVVSMLADENIKSLMAGVIDDITNIQLAHTESVAALNAAHTESFAALTTSHNAALAEAQEATIAAQASAEESKTKFSTSVVIEGDNVSLADTEDKVVKKTSSLASFIKENY